MGFFCFFFFWGGTNQACQCWCKKVFKKRYQSLTQSRGKPSEACDYAYLYVNLILEICTLWSNELVNEIQI